MLRSANGELLMTMQSAFGWSSTKYLSIMQHKELQESYRFFNAFLGRIHIVRMAQ